MVNEVEELMSRIRPRAREHVRFSLIHTLTNMIRQHSNETQELQAVEAELGNEDFGAW